MKKEEAILVVRYLKGCCPRLVDVLGREVSQDRQVLADVVSVLVSLLSEGHRAIAAEVLLKMQYEIGKPRS